VWTRTVNGRVLHFYLAGINNQNFLMRDKETGTWWQQITGKAIYGPLQGASLELVLSDELTFGEWKSEFSDGKVLAPVPKYIKEYDSNWEPEIAKLPVVISFPGTELKSRDVVVGLEIDGASRAYPVGHVRQTVSHRRPRARHAAACSHRARRKIVPHSSSAASMARMRNFS
jgi:hypothetical protein